MRAISTSGGQQHLRRAPKLQDLRIQADHNLQGILVLIYKQSKLVVDPIKGDSRTKSLKGRPSHCNIQYEIRGKDSKWERRTETNLFPWQARWMAEPHRCKVSPSCLPLTHTTSLKNSTPLKIQMLYLFCTYMQKQGRCQHF